jgi:hypothetical protein
MSSTQDNSMEAFDAASTCSPKSMDMATDKYTGSPIKTQRKMPVSSPPRRFFGCSPTFDEDDDASIPAPPPIENNLLLSPRTPLRPSNGGRSGQGMKTASCNILNPHSAAYALTPTIRNTHATANRAAAHQTSTFCPVGASAVVSPEDKFSVADFPREIGFADDDDDSVNPFDMSRLSVLGEDVFGEDECNEGNGLDGKSRCGSFSLLPASSSFMQPPAGISGDERGGLLPLRVHAKSSGFLDIQSVAANAATQASFMLPRQENAMIEDDDCDDTIEDDDLNYQGDVGEGEDHIAKIVFPSQDEKNLSFRSFDEGGFRRAVRSSSIRLLMARNAAASNRTTTNCSPLTVGSLERRSSSRGSFRVSSNNRGMPYALYQPSRNDSLTEFGMHDAALAVADIFQDDHSIASSFAGNNDINLYRPFPMRKGNSTGSHYSIPSLRMGAPLPSAWDDGSVGTFMSSLAGGENAWHESLGEIGGSFDEADPPAARAEFSFAFASAARPSKQNAFDWLEEVKKDGPCVAEAASSKFLREQQGAKACPPTHANRANTPTPLSGKPPLAFRRPSPVANFNRSVSMPVKPL